MSKWDVVEEIHRGARKNFERRRTLMHGLNDTYQIDLWEMIPYAKLNKKYKYILIVIDTFSKFCWAFPLLSKSGKHVTEQMSKLLKSSNVPRHVMSDFGKEFYNSSFKQLMKRYKINHYSSFSSTKAAIAERLIRTLKNKLFKRLHFRGSYKWIDILDEIVATYNSTKHSTIRMKPCDVRKRHEQMLLNSVYNYSMHIKNDSKFKVDDFVRISKYKHVFEKGYMPNWTTEIFKISKVQRTQPITYLLTDIDGTDIKGAFYELELQRVKHPDIYLVEKIIKRRGDSYFVKWLGFDDSYNEWIKKNDIINN